MDPGCSLPVTLNRLDMLIDKQGLERSDVLDFKQLAASSALPEGTVRHLLAGGEPSADIVNERSARV
ncbi:hypothetical protein ABZS98_28085 [Streptomyces avermitilis]|uniref:hypothetical protein n=1 Tax=Streptomyces avermitilis TaxID=33903 RepID=UPI0033AF23F3